MARIPAFIIWGATSEATKLPETGKGKRSRYKWKKVTGTAHATPGTETSHAHGLGRIPKQVLIEPHATNGVVQSTAADDTNIYVKGLAVSPAFTAWVLG